MNKKTYYQIDTQGRLREWSVRVEDNGPEGATIVVESGLQGGAMVASRTPVTEGKNLGRSNETTPYQQACMDAQSEIDKKTTKGYVDDPARARSSSSLGSGAPAPMLAHKYDPEMRQSGSKDLAKLGILGKTVMVGDKLDGNRCLAHVRRDRTDLYTRRGKLFLPIRHIQDELSAHLREIYDYVNRKYGVTEYWVDGELFTQKYPFNKVNGALKKEDRTPEHEAVIRDVKYHVYDVVIQAGYETRHKVIRYFDGDSVRPLLSEEVTATPETLADRLEDALNRGQEGLIIRQLGMPYENKRTRQLLKYKVFEDAEFTVVGFKESIEGDTLGSIEFEMPDGKRFFARWKATDEEQKQLWDERDRHLGRTMTVEYFGLSAPEEGGKPRFPIAKSFR